MRKENAEQFCSWTPIMARLDPIAPPSLHHVMIGMTTTNAISNNTSHCNCQQENDMEAQGERTRDIAIDADRLQDDGEVPGDEFGYGSSGMLKDAPDYGCALESSASDQSGGVASCHNSHQEDRITGLPSFSFPCHDDVILARTLQEKEYEEIRVEMARAHRHDARNMDSDRMIAEMIQNSDGSREFNVSIEDHLSRTASSSTNNGIAADDEDTVLAQSLQLEEYGTVGQPNSSEAEMMMTSTGKAVLFVKELIEKIQCIHMVATDPKELEVNAIARDDLVFMAERLMDTQQLFVRNGKPCQIDLGYHFTKEQALDRIRTDGLLTRKDQRQSGSGGVTSSGTRSLRRLYGGGHFGDGIYTANNPFSFNYFGPVGLLVARIKGQSIVRGQQAVRSESEVEGYDTVIGNKSPSADPEKDEIVLRTSSQTLPLIRFPRSVLPPGRQQPQNVEIVLNKFCVAVQETIEKFFTVRSHSISMADQVYADPPETHRPPSFPTPAVAPPPATRPSLWVSPGPTQNKHEAFGSLQPVALKSKERAGGVKLCGVCESCSTQAHAIGHSLTYSRRNVDVYQGICIRCNPNAVPSGILSQWQARNSGRSAPAKYPDIADKFIENRDKPIRNNNEATLHLVQNQQSNQQLSISPFASAHKTVVERYGQSAKCTANGNSIGILRPAWNHTAASTAGHEVIGFDVRNFNSMFRLWTYKAPDHLFEISDVSNLDSVCNLITTGNIKTDCPICMEKIVPAPESDNSWDLGCELKVCGHAVHIHCLAQALKFSSRCPVCRFFVNNKKPQGTSPTGTMDIAYFPSSSAICDGHRAIRITYILEGGVQKSYHDNPGKTYRGDRRIAYLPDSQEGQQLLRRLVFAFRHGLTFRVGSSLTTGRTNCITWASIHHKTSCRPGPHGFPDPAYFRNCNAELNSLGVPMHPNSEAR